jgi:hypothetical protein
MVFLTEIHWLKRLIAANKLDQLIIWVIRNRISADIEIKCAGQFLPTGE